MLRIAFAQVYIRCALAEAVHLSLGHAFISLWCDNSLVRGSRGGCSRKATDLPFCQKSPCISGAIFVGKIISALPSCP